ncbi:hypothetical protein RND71_024498 [Anisodus tanguticus]|uniref:Uncharacterized protein n=1 Tax=Anisodus tanguticus TaxID=243964 RepID=A0AAE1RQM3_9SOLA|nr:hypothetical protein RND71_024498 [Anisodus tanguticus]
MADGPNHSALTTDNEQSKHSQSAAFTSKRKISKVNGMIVRRSNRLKSLGSFRKRQGLEAVQHIDLTYCDREKETHDEPISLKSIRNRGRRPFASETTPTNRNYKIRYTNSEKKIEALTEENYRHAQKLSYLLGKVKIVSDIPCTGCILPCHVVDAVVYSQYEITICSLMNLAILVILHPVAAALNSAPAPKPSPVKKKKNSVKRMKRD